MEEVERRQSEDLIWKGGKEITEVSNFPHCWVFRQRMVTREKRKIGNRERDPGGFFVFVSVFFINEFSPPA